MSILALREERPPPAHKVDTRRGLRPSLCDLRREHGHPPADVQPAEPERFAGMMLLAVMRRAYERASYCPTAVAWLEPGQDQFR